MEEMISIHNFLVIKKAHIDIKKFNVIIGPQANGKSVIAKMLYFFKKTSSDFLRGIQSNKSKRELDADILAAFEKRFPRYSWDGTSFNINYKINDINISIIGTKNSRNKTSLKIIYCKELLTIFNAKKKLYKKKIEEFNSDQQKISRRGPNSEQHIFFEAIQYPMMQGPYSFFFSTPVFVPAARSFFANLQKNIFTFLASNLDIDPFLKDFGSLYENSKRWYKNQFISSQSQNRHKEIIHELYKTMEAIVDGEYDYHDEQDWILSKGRKINLANASSGQQESLPMLLTLRVWPLVRSDETGGMFFIEEPEAHLFPTSQGHIMSILSLLYHSLGTRFFLTSHSPYILSALNNLIMAAEVINENKMTLDEFRKINGGGMPIKYNDISAYTIINGVATQIKDDEYKIVGGDILDKISEHFEDVMNKMLECGA